MNENEDTQIDYNDDDAIANSISGLLNDDLSINDDIPEDREESSPEPIQESQEEDSLPEDYKVKVKINGVEQEVPLSELKNGYQRQSDYTQKTQALSEERKALEAQTAEYTQYLQSIPMLAQVATANINEAQTKLYSPEFTQLAIDDPAQYVAEKAKLEGIIQKNYQAQQQMQQQFEQYQNQSNNIRQQEFEQQLQEANTILAREIPEWEKGEVINQLRTYAVDSMKFTPSELEGLIDPRQVIVLNKARLYDEMMANQNLANKRVQAVPPKSLKPGSVSTTTAAQDEWKSEMKRVVKSNNDRDIADLMSKLL